MRGAACTTMEEAWQAVRQKLGDDVAQQAMVETLAKWRYEENPVGQYLAASGYLHGRGYDDGAEVHHPHRGSRVMTQQLVPADLASQYDEVTPEMEALAREEVRARLMVTGREAVYTPKTDPEQCYKGHVGQMVFATRSSNGRVRRWCRVCERDRRGKSA